LLMLVAFLYLNTKLESVDFTPFAWMEFTQAYVFHCCVIFFCWTCVSVFQDLCVQTFVWINRFGFVVMIMM